MTKVLCSLLDSYGLRLTQLAFTTAYCVLALGCVPQQADLKQAERDLQKKIKQSNEEQVQTRARQSQEISAIREQELPTLRGDLDKVFHQMKEIESRIADLQARIQHGASSGEAESPLFKAVEDRLNKQDEVISSLLVQMDELAKQIKAQKSQ